MNNDSAGPPPKGLDLVLNASNSVRDFQRFPQHTSRILTPLLIASLKITSSTPSLGFLFPIYPFLFLLNIKRSIPSSANASPFVSKPFFAVAGLPYHEVSNVIVFFFPPNVVRLCVPFFLPNVPRQNSPSLFSHKMDRLTFFVFSDSWTVP